MMESTYSTSSFSGLVSSKRRLVCPPNSSAYPKSMQIALACPMCRYPLGLGGKRVCTRPLYLLVFRSSIKRSRMKLEGRDSGAASAVSGSVFDVFIILDLIAKEDDELQHRVGRRPQVLETFAERVQALIEVRRIVPERCVPSIRHQLNLRMRHRRLVLVDRGRFDNRIRGTVRDQHRFANLRKEIVVAERTGEQALTDIGRDRDVVSQHQIHLRDRRRIGETQAQQAFQTADSRFCLR